MSSAGEYNPVYNFFCYKKHHLPSQKVVTADRCKT